MGFLNFFFFSFTFSNLEKKKKKRTNREPPRVSGAREQCKKLLRTDYYLVVFVTGFLKKSESYAGPTLRNPLVSPDKDALRTCLLNVFYVGVLTII